jgi:hypothetical protein
MAGGASWLEIPVEAIEYTAVLGRPITFGESPADVTRLLGTVINELRSGTLEPKIGTAIAYIAGVLLTSMDECSTRFLAG